MKKKPEKEPIRKVQVGVSYLMFERGDILREEPGGAYVRILDVKDLEPAISIAAALENAVTQRPCVELTIEECERPLSGLYVVGVLNLK